MESKRLKEVRAEYERFGLVLKAAEDKAFEVDAEEKRRVDSASPDNTYWWKRKQNGEYYRTGAAGTREAGALRRAALDFKHFLTRKL